MGEGAKTGIKKADSVTVRELSRDLLKLEYVYLKTISKWNRNARRHGLREIIASIREHGFKDPMKWESALNNGTGGVVEGNGRDDALLVMFAEDCENPPRGVVYDDSASDWIVPVLFGVDAESQAAAEAYAVDHNNTALAGAFSEAEIMRIWKPEMGAVISEIAKSDHKPATVSVEMAATLADLAAKREQSGAAIELTDSDDFGGDPPTGGSNVPETPEIKTVLHQCPKCAHISEVNIK